MKPILALLLAMISCAIFAGDLPDRTLTPGALNPDIRQDNIQSTVCVKGFTKTIRPPAYVTNKLKKRQIREYGYQDTNSKHYEEDHLVPLSVGGHPTDPANLWPQPRKSEWNAEKRIDLSLPYIRLSAAGISRLMTRATRLQRTGLQPTNTMATCLASMATGTANDQTNPAHPQFKARRPLAAGS